MRRIAALMIFALGTNVARAEPNLDAAALLEVPDGCQQFIPTSGKHPAFWDRWLSLASCMLEATTPRVEHPFEVRDLAEHLVLAFQPSMLIWQRALFQAPLETQLRAGFHVGLAMVALMTRARSALAAPAHMTRPDAARREALLRARLEPLLAVPKQIAWTAFSTISEHVNEHPEFEQNPVHAAMVRSARMHLGALERPSDPPDLGPTQSVRASR